MAHRPSLLTTLDSAQRIVLVIGMGLVLCVFGLWVTHIGSHGLGARRAMALLRPGAGGVPPWGRFLIWLMLIALWSAASLWLLRQPHGSDSREQ